MAQTFKILIAEDDRMTRRLLQRTFAEHAAFEGLAMDPLLAEDGGVAMTLFQQETPDLVIADLLMPRVDGFALCQAIREHENGMHVPIIVTSAIWKQPELLDKLKTNFGVAFVEKPFNIDELIATVKSMLGLTA